MGAVSEPPREFVSSSEFIVEPEPSRPRGLAVHDISADLAIGFRPAPQLSVESESLFRSYQSNLLSLVSHELRTPLSGVINSIILLEEAFPPGSSETTQGAVLLPAELVQMAHRSAERLRSALADLLDVAALASRSFHARLREVDLMRLGQARVAAWQKAPRAIALTCVVETGEEGAATDGTPWMDPILADPQKLGRAIELSLQAFVPKLQDGDEVLIRISSKRFRVQSALPRTRAESWRQNYQIAQTAAASGILSPASAFGGMVQSEELFLSRTEEGLGSELMLIHEILKLHQGEFHMTFTDASRDSIVVGLELELPLLDSERGIRAVLAARTESLVSGLGSLALVVIEVPESFLKTHGVRAGTEDFRRELRKGLFRATDSLYPWLDSSCVALIMEDLPPEAVGRLIERLSDTVHQGLRFGVAHCPVDGEDPAHLLSLARTRLEHFSVTP